jgi:hypothetical protein
MHHTIAMPAPQSSHSHHTRISLPSDSLQHSYDDDFDDDIAKRDDDGAAAAAKKLPRSDGKGNKHGKTGTLVTLDPLQVRVGVRVRVWGILTKVYSLSLLYLAHPPTNLYNPCELACFVPRI